MSPRVLGIDHVQLAGPAGCEAAARHFYGGLLGLPEVPKPENLRASGGAWFAAGAQELHIGIEEPFAPARKAHPSLVTDDVEALAAALADAGFPIRWDERIPDVPRFYAEDPFGNRLEIRAA